MDTRTAVGMQKYIFIKHNYKFPVAKKRAIGSLAFVLLAACAIEVFTHG